MTKLIMILIAIANGDEDIKLNDWQRPIIERFRREADLYSADIWRHLLEGRNTSCDFVSWLFEYLRPIAIMVQDGQVHLHLAGNPATEGRVETYKKSGVLVHMALTTEMAEQAVEAALSSEYGVAVSRPNVGMLAGTNTVSATEWSPVESTWDLDIVQ